MDRYVNHSLETSMKNYKKTLKNSLLFSKSNASLFLLQTYPGQFKG